MQQRRRARTPLSHADPSGSRCKTPDGRWSALPAVRRIIAYTIHGPPWDSDPYSLPPAWGRDGPWSRSDRGSRGDLGAGDRRPSVRQGLGVGIAKDNPAQVASRCSGAEEIGRSVVVIRQGVSDDDPDLGSGEEFVGSLPNRHEPFRGALLGSGCDDRRATALVVSQPAISVDRDGGAVGAPVQGAVELTERNSALLSGFSGDCVRPRRRVRCSGRRSWCRWPIAAPGGRRNETPARARR
jgi:hypothetical protein